MHAWEHKIGLHRTACGTKPPDEARFSRQGLEFVVDWHVDPGSSDGGRLEQLMVWLRRAASAFLHTTTNRLDPEMIFPLIWLTQFDIVFH